jgi:glycolate oxidase iron-sulfur subunit
MFGSEKSESEIEQKLGLLDSLQLSCTACGICNESCATYQASGWEHESPRGRIRLSRDFLEGKIHPSSKALQTFDRCLGCRACEASCPISVQYQSIRGIVQHIRIVLNPDQKMSRSEQQWIKLAWRIGSRRWRTYGSRWLKDLLVSSGSYLYRYSKKEFFFLQPLKLVVSCIQDLCQHELIQQTIELLNKLGVQVCLDRRQPCCGAVFERLVQYDRVQKYQEKRVRDFNHWMPEQVCFLAKNCQQFALKHCQEKQKIVDLYELIFSRLNALKIKLSLDQPLTAYYQQPCHQEGVDYAWKLLNQIDGLSLKTLWPAKSCCGGYAGEALLNPAQAAVLREAKLRSLPDNSILVVSSHDCWLQFKQQKNLQLLYPTQLLFNSNTIFQIDNQEKTN